MDKYIDEYALFIQAKEIDNYVQITKGFNYGEWIDCNQ